MRIYEEGKRVLLALGKEEAEILLGLLSAAHNVFPILNYPDKKGDRWSSDRRRIADMIRSFSVYLGLTKYEQRPGHHTLPKNTPCPYCVKSLRGEKALAMHIENIHSGERK